MSMQHRILKTLSREHGQGTVEYVGIMLLLATVLTAVVAAASGNDFDMAKTITDEVKAAIDKVVGNE